MNLLEQSTRGLVLCALLGVATMALAECDNSPNSPGELHVCKPWPAEDGINIGVRATPVQGAENAKVPRYNLDVALLLDDSGWAVASYNKDLARRSDGLALQGLQIDTGRYQLSEEERAFGLRATYRRASSTHPHEKTVLTLFVRDGKGLPPRLEGWWWMSAALSSAGAVSVSGAAGPCTGPWNWATASATAMPTCWCVRESSTPSISRGRPVAKAATWRPGTAVSPCTTTASATPCRKP